MDELRALESLAQLMGAYTRFTDGLGRSVSVQPATLVRVCAALGAPVARPADATEALRAVQHAKETAALPPVVVAWDGDLDPLELPIGTAGAAIRLEDGDLIQVDGRSVQLRTSLRLPLGYHQLMLEVNGQAETCAVISAPTKAWRRSEGGRSWGVGTHLAALRSGRIQGSAGRGR